MMKYIISLIIAITISFSFQSIWFHPSFDHSRSIASISHFNCYKVIQSFLTKKTAGLTNEYNRLEHRLLNHQLEKNNPHEFFNDLDHYQAFVRDPREYIIQPDYLLKYIHVIETSNYLHFLPWLMGKSDQDFSSLMITQHQYLVDEGLRGYFFGVKVDNEIMTGKFRTRRLDHVNFLLERAQKDNIPDKLTFVEIEDIPSEMLPWYRRGQSWIDEHQFKYQYPDPKYIETYVKQMDILMQMIREDLTQLESNKNLAKSYQQKIIKNLAKYYQLGMAAHVFDRINNSLFMSHVNIILGILGVKPVPHGYLDFVALTRDTDEFIKYFEDYVGKKGAGVFSRRIH